MNDIKTADELVQLYNAQADLLSQAVQALQKERDDAQRDNAYLVRALTAARDERAYAEQSRDAIAADRDTRAAKIEDMADASREATELLQTLTKERDGIKASLLTVRTDRDFVMEQLATARKMRDDVLAAHSETRSKLSHQCDENEALRKTLLATTEERNDLRTTAKAIAEKRDELQALIITHTKKYADLQRYVDEVVSCRNTFSRQLQEMSIERTNLRTEVNKLQNLHTNQRETVLQLQAAAGERTEPTQQELMDRASDDADRIREINRQLGYAFNSIGVARNELSKLD